MHEGTIAGVDNKHLYLNLGVNEQMQRGYYNPYQPYYPGPGPYPGSYPPYNNNVILPLVLFELLAISLL